MIKLTKQDVLAKLRAGGAVIFNTGYPNPWIEKVGERRQDFDTHILMSLVCEGFVVCRGRTHPAETLYVFGANSGPITLMPTHMPEKISVSRLTSLESVV